MLRRVQVPGNSLGKFLREPRHPKTKTAVARTITNDQQASRRNGDAEPRQQRALLRQWKIMEHIEERDVSAKLRNRLPNILLVKTDVAIAISRRISGVPDFWSIDIESGNGSRATGCRQIKREQTDAATNIDKRSN